MHSWEHSHENHMNQGEEKTSKEASTSFITKQENLSVVAIIAYKNEIN